MSARTIFATENDHRRLRSLIATLQRMSTDEDYRFDELSRLLDSATIVKPRDIPPDVITMNSTIRLDDLANGEKLYVTLVFPHKADLEAEAISILSSLGTTLYGRKCGESLSGDVNGQIRNLRVAEVLYQPEADGKTSMDYTT